VPADEAYLRIFTSGYRMVWETTFTKAEKPEFLEAGDHDVTWNGRDDQSRPMPPGYYICFISVTVGKKTYETNSKTEIP
jgi:flagellar hook assembly protein FlgD